MELSLRIFLFVFIAIYFFIVIYLLKKAAFATKYALIWLIGGFLMLLFAVFPKIVFATSAVIGISNPVNAIFFFVCCFMMVLLISLTAIVSGLNSKSLKLIQAVALLEERVHRLEGKEDDNNGEAKKN